TYTALAGVGLGAEVVIVARRPVARRWVRAQARGRIAGPGVVALVGGRAHHRVRTLANLGLADVGLRTRIAIVARRLIRRGDPDTAPRPAAVLPRALIAVVARRPFRHRHPAAGPAPTLVPARARIAVVTRRPLRHRRPRAEPVQARIPARA